MIARSLARIVQEVFRCRIAAGLMPSDVPIGVGYRNGTWTGRPLAMRTRHYEGGGYSLRISEVASDSALEALTVLFLPSRESGHPIFFAEILAFGGVLSEVTVDVTSKGPQGSRARLESAKLDLERCGTVRPFHADLPSPFSTEAGHITPHPGMNDAVTLAIGRYLSAFELSSRADIPPHQAARSEDDFLAKLTAMKAKPTLLSKLFGPTFTREYLQFFCGPSRTQRLHLPECFVEGFEEVPTANYSLNARAEATDRAPASRPAKLG